MKETETFQESKGASEAPFFANNVGESGCGKSTVGRTIIQSFGFTIKRMGKYYMILFPFMSSTKVS